MESLTKSQQDSIKKLSTDALRLKLLRSGYEEEVVCGMARDELLTRWAETVVAGQDRPEPMVAPEVRRVGGYDIEFEREKLAFEKLRYEEEKQERTRENDRKEQELALRKLELEQQLEFRTKELEQQAEFKTKELLQEAERARLEAEKIKLETDLRGKELKQKEVKLKAEMELKERETQRQVARDEAERERNNSLAVKIKTFGDALKNSITIQSSDPFETIAFFRNAEHLFDSLKVPNELRGTLIRPYLNSRSKELVGRMDPVKSTKYDEIKGLILKEYKMSPAMYRDSFNNLTKREGETFAMFISRLKAVLTYYIESRGVTTLIQLIDLLVSDRVKSCLSESCLRHVLSVESATDLGWVDSTKLGATIDCYLANHVGDRPRAASLGQPGQRFDGAGGKGSMVTPFRPFPHKVQSGSTGQVPMGFADKKPKGCFICGSLSHLKASCDKYRNRGRPEVQNSVRRVNTCTTDRGWGVEQSNPTLGSIETAQVKSQQPELIGETKGVVFGPDPMAAVDVVATQEDVVSAVNQVVITETVDNPISCAIDVNKPYDFARLNYVDVRVAGEPGNCFQVFSALDDGGAEVAVAKPSTIEHLSYVECVGSTALRGIIGAPVNAKLVRLYISLDHKCNVGIDCDLCKQWTPVLCAVCEEANDALVLTASNVDQLRSYSHRCNAVVQQYLNEIEDESDGPNTGSDAHGRMVDSNIDDDKLNDGVIDLNDANNVTDDHVDPEAKVILSSGDGKVRASVDELISEQQSDDTLRSARSLALRGKGGFFYKDGLLMHQEKLLGQEITQLCLPLCRRNHVLELGHELGGHLGPKRTGQRIRLSFYWCTVTQDTKRHCQSCEVCQKKARITFRDRVPIQPIPRAEVAFSHWFMDCLGPITSDKCEFNYCLVLVDSATRYPAAFPLRSLTAKSICDCLMSLFMYFGVASVISSDNATNFTSRLNREFMNRLGCSPRFSSCYHPQATGLVERMVGTVKSSLAKMAADHPKSWHKYLGFVMWALREIPNETTGVAPWLLAFGQLPRGPLAVLKETWCGEREFPLDLGKTPFEYLKDLHKKLEIAKSYAEAHTKREQTRYANRYNLRSRDKHFNVGDKVLILQPDSTTSRLHSKWKGPATVVEVKSPYSYIVELDDRRYRLHANQLRQFHVKTVQINFDTRALTQPYIMEKEAFTVATCAIIYDQDQDFGDIETVDKDDLKMTDVKDDVFSLPSKRIDPVKLEHLSRDQQRDLLGVLDKFPDVFSDSPGFCDVVMHSIPVSGEFKPKRLHAYRVPERLKPEVDKQINDLLKRGFIKPSKSPMASPLVCVLKGKDGKDGVRLAIDYRYLNKYTIADAFPMPDMADVVQRIGMAKYISTFDACSGYWQTAIQPSDQWLSAFVCDAGLYEWTRTPFGMKSSGNTFVRAVQYILQPIKSFTDAYIDDMAVYSTEWCLHLNHLRQFLQRVRVSGLTLKLQKCHFALPEVKFCGELVGSGIRRADPGKVTAVNELKVPVTKTHVRQVLGFFGYFRDHIPNYASIARPLTDLTGKRINNKVPWGSVEQKAFDDLKAALCDATISRLHIIDLSQPFHLYVDASDHTVAGVLTQWGVGGTILPVAFASQKLNDTQKRWATVEKEAYAALTMLRKFRSWIWGTRITIHSDHNPLTYLTESAPKSAKLMRWALALQEFDVDFSYYAGKMNVAADTLTRMGPD